MANDSIGFIGCGAMGGAIARAMCKKYSDVLTVADARLEHAQKFAEENKCRFAKTNIEVAESSRYVFLAVKPAQLPELLKEISSCLKKDAVLISMATSVPLAKLCSFCPKDTHVVRIMPNICALAGEAMIAACFSGEVSDEERDAVCSMLGGAGIVKCVDENLMDCVTAVSGSGPAYAFIFIEAMADAAVMFGMKRADAYVYAAQTLKGAAALMLETGTVPAALKDSVCSPGGTTIEAVAELERGGFRAAIIDAVAAAYEKSVSMR